MASPRYQRQDEDLELIRRCHSGEREAFARLVEAYQNDLFGKIYRWVGQKEVAEEMAQDVFLKAYRDLKSFRGDAKFSTWLFQIALNRCRDFWRVQKRSPDNWVPLEDRHDLAHGEVSADQEIERNQKIQRLRSAMSELPEIYREALGLKFLNDLSCEEIAHVTKQGLSNVKMRLLRGVEKLRKKLS